MSLLVTKKGPHAQPRGIGDVLLHETAISWLRREEENSRPKKPWEETPHEFAKRLQDGVRRINKGFDVRGLCSEFPSRLETLVAGSKLWSRRRRATASRSERRAVAGENFTQNNRTCRKRSTHMLHFSEFPSRLET